MGVMGIEYVCQDPRSEVLLLGESLENETPDNVVSSSF